MTFPTMEVQLNREYWLLFRDALLKQVDAIEKMLGITPTSAELRKIATGKIQVSENVVK